MRTTQELSGTTRTTNVRAVSAILSLCGLAVAVQQTSLVPAIADLHHTLNTTPENVSWIITATLVSSAVCMPIVSRIADMYGKRRMMLFSLGLMLVGSIIGAVGGSLGLIILGRALQGASFAVIPVGISVMRDVLPPERVGSGIAIMSATLSIGGAVGLPVGGFMYTHFGVGSIFVLAAVLSAALFVATRLFIPESDIMTRGKVDVLGAVLLSIALMALLLPISKGATWGWASPLTLSLFAASLVVFVAWVPLQLRLTQPMVDLRTLARRPVALTNAATVLLGFAMFGSLLGTTQMLTGPVTSSAGFGFTPMEAGLFMLPPGAAMVVLARLSATMSAKFGAKFTLVVGGALLAAGYVLMILLDSTLVGLMVALFFTNSGIALAYAALPALIMRAVPVTETASANGLNALLRSIGTSTSSAVVAMVFAAWIEPSGRDFVPSQTAFHMVFGLSAAAAVIGTLIAMALPKHRADLSDEDAFSDVDDPGAEFDSPDVAAERAEIEHEVAEGKTTHTKPATGR